MPTHVALLRGVNNLGGKTVAMAELREVATSLGHTDVMTYIQSGNVLFTPPPTGGTRVAVTPCCGPSACFPPKGWPSPCRDAALTSARTASNFRHGQPWTLVDNGGHHARGQAGDGPGSLPQYLGS